VTKNVPPQERMPVLRSGLTWRFRRFWIESGSVRERKTTALRASPCAPSELDRLAAYDLSVWTSPCHVTFVNLRVNLEHIVLGNPTTRSRVPHRYAIRYCEIQNKGCVWLFELLRNCYCSSVKTCGDLPLSLRSSHECRDSFQQRSCSPIRA